MIQVLFRDMILKVSPYMFGYIEKALPGKQRSEKGENIAIVIKMFLKLIFIAPINDLLVCEWMARLSI